MQRTTGVRTFDVADDDRRAAADVRAASPTAVASGRGHGEITDLPAGAGWVAPHVHDDVLPEVLDSFIAGSTPIPFAEGYGVKPNAGQGIKAHYSGDLLNGAKFDSSYDRRSPLGFNVGTGRVIKGWDQGVAGMRIGGKRKLTIPPELGYGARGAGGVIPPNATLVFEVELLGLS